MKKIVLAIAFLFASLSLPAQSAAFLNISPDAYTMGMAGASIALNPTAFAFYNNPAAMVFYENTGSIAASYNLWQPSASNNRLFAASGFGKSGDKMAFGFSGRFVTHQPYDITNDQGVVSGTYTPREYALEGGGAFKIWRFAIGVTFRYIGSDLGGEKPGSAFGADLALMYKTETLSLAASVVNFGTNLNYGGDSTYTLPTMSKVGFAYNIAFLEQHRASLGLEWDYLFSGGSMVAGGLEYAFKETAFLRLGYHWGDADKAIPSYASIGLGVKFYGVTINAAYLIAFGESPMKNTLSLSLGYDF